MMVGARALLASLLLCLYTAAATAADGEFPPGVSSVTAMGARALYGGDPSVVSNLGVYHMRQDNLEAAAHAYAAALRRMRFFQQDDETKPDEVRENIAAYKERLAASRRLSRAAKTSCLRTIALAEADIAHADLPPFTPVEELYAQHRDAADAADAATAKPPASSMRVGGPTGFFRFLKSKTFRHNYFERWPVLMRVGRTTKQQNHTTTGDDRDDSDDGTGGRDFTSVLTLDEFLDQRYTYGMSKDERGHANFHMVKGSFRVQHPTLTFPTPVSRAEIEREVVRGDFTGITHGTQLWVPSVFKFNRRVAGVTGRAVNTNTYVTGPGTQLSMSPHNDLQCTLIVQLHGAKRWRVWVVEAAMLPVDSRHVYGKDGQKELDPARLGDPHMDVVLRPGDVLYVPRGAIHTTSTVFEDDQVADGLQDEPSLHLTVGIETLQDHASMARYHFLGGLPNKRPATKALAGHLHHALARVAYADVEMRRGVSRDVLRAGKRHLARERRRMRAEEPWGAAQEEEERSREATAGNNGAWKADLRGLMHKAVDELFDGTTFAEESAAELYRTVVLDIERGGRQRAPKDNTLPEHHRVPRVTFGEELVVV